MVGRRGVGDAFGELALTSDQPRKATVRASAATTLLCLGRDTFERLVGPLGKNMDDLRRRFHVAAYSYGRRDYPKLFRHYDKDNSGFLEELEFRAAVRKDGQMDMNTVSEKELRTLYVPFRPGWSNRFQ